MAEMTEGERLAQYNHDIAIINRQADARIAGLNATYSALEQKHIAVTEKQCSDIEKKYDAKIEAIKTKAAQDVEGLELEKERSTDLLKDIDIQFLDEAKGKMEKSIATVEAWRRTESDSELHQLQTHTQRPRRD